MRIRSRDTQRNEYTISRVVTRRKFTAVPIGLYDGYNTSPVLPDVPATKLDTIASDLRFDRERIVDEVSVDRRLKAVDHMKISVPLVEPELHADTGYGSTSKNTYPPKVTVAHMWRGVLRSRIPMSRAWEDARSGAILSLSALPPNDNALLSALGAAPPDRLGELPARLVAAIEEWHLMTTVAEASDYARLMDFAKKRGPLRASATELQNWQRSRSDFSRRYRGKTTRQTLWNLASAYRQGQLGFSFGIMPTVNEVRTVSEMLSEGVKPAQTRITRTIRGQNQVNKNFTSREGNAIYWRYTRNEHVCIDRVDGVTADLKRPIVKNTAMRNMLNRLVGVSGARIIWDFVPWSFVVDWFLSVDDALDTLWLHSQTEYDIGFWSSTKTLYNREVLAHCLSIEDFYPANVRTFIRTPPVSVNYTHYIRTPRAQPSLLDSLRFRMGPKQGFLTTLLGLGLVPRSFTRKLKKLAV